MSISFIHDAGNVTITRAPARGDNALSFQQAAEETAGATRFAYPLYVKDAVFDLPLRMTTVEKAEFLAFWNTTVRGSIYPFTYRDAFGVATVVRFASPVLPEISERSYDLHICTVKLRHA